MFKITKEDIRKVILKHTCFSKEAAEFLSGYLIDKNSSMPIDCFMSTYLDDDENKRIQKEQFGHFATAYGNSQRTSPIIERLVQ